MPEINASPFLQEKVAEYEHSIDIVTNHAVKEFKIGKGNKLEAVMIEDRATGAVREWETDGVFVFIGLTPNTQFLDDRFEADEWGFIKTHENLMTSVEGVFAAGDVRAGSTKQAASAAGEGATAALMIREYLERIGH